VLYQQTDRYFDATAYTILGVWITVNAFQQVYERGITLQVEQTAAGCSCYKNVMSLPVLIASAYVTGELDDLPDSVLKLSSSSMLLILASGGLGFGISFCYNTLNKISTSTTITVANNFNKLLTTMAAQVVFAETLLPVAVGGLLVSIVASLGYALEMGRQPKPAAKTDKKTLGIRTLVFVGSLSVATVWFTMRKTETLRTEL